MVHHLVLYKFLPNTTEEQIKNLSAALLNLSKNAPGLDHYVWGISVSKMNLEKGYTHGFIMTFTNSGFLDNYVKSKAHQELVSKYINPICDQGLVFAIEE